LSYDNPIEAHLNKESTEYATAGFSTPFVYVYRYSPTEITFEYSFFTGTSAFVEGVAYNPRSKE
jgi:hypothetical protein